MSTIDPFFSKPRTQNRIRIAWFITSLESGGSERQLAALLEGLPGDRYEKHVICLSGYGMMEESVRRTCDGLYDLKYPRLRVNGKLQWSKLPHVVAAVRRLAKLLRRIRPDILHTLIPVCNVMGALACRIGPEVKLISSRLSLGNYRDVNKALARLEDFTDPQFDIIHCKSEGIREDVLRREPVRPDQTRVIYNGLRVERYARISDAEIGAIRKEWGISPDEVIIGMVANLKPYKGHLDMIRALALLVRDHPNAKLFCVGRDDGIAGDLITEAETLGVGQNLILTGERDDVPRLMQMMTLLISASHEEGFSNVILEAMATGLPVVATAVGGNVEQVVDGVTGLLVPPQDVDALATAVGDLLTEDQASIAMGVAGRERVLQLFSYQAMVHGIMQMYATDLNA